MMKNLGMWGVVMEDWIYVTKSSMPPIKNYVRHLYDLWETRHLTNQGEKHEQLQQMLASELGVAHVALTANGHLALELALKALGCTGEVITTPFTFASEEKRRGFQRSCLKRISTPACACRCARISAA